MIKSTHRSRNGSDVPLRQPTDQKAGGSNPSRRTNVSQLVCLSNLENLNAVFINEGIPQTERLAKLNAIAISPMKVLTEDHRMLQLDTADKI